jgi:hypothetical protein
MLIVWVKVREVLPNCPRYVHKMELVERSSYTLRADCETLIASWKLNREEFDALSASNQALDLEYEKRSAGDAKP